jgi:hypothetical protein
MTQEGIRRLRTPALKMAFCVFLAAILISLFRWTLVEYITPFIEPIFEITIGLLFLVSLIWSVVHLTRAWRQGAGLALSPLVINLITVLVVAFVPFTLLTTQLNFRMHYGDRMAAVSSVLDGRYENLVRNRGGRGDLITLPPQLSYLSSGGGDIMRWHRPNATLIFFFDYRGILDSFSGFVYSTDDSPPRDGDFGGRFVEIERLRQNWFWATSRN